MIIYDVLHPIQEIMVNQFRKCTVNKSDLVGYILVIKRLIISKMKLIN